MQAIGATEAERAVAVELLKSGGSFEDVLDRFPGVERDYWERNKGDLFERAGLVEKPKAKK